MQDSLRISGQNGVKSIPGCRRLVRRLALAGALFAMAGAALAQAPACLLGSPVVGAAGQSFALSPYAETATVTTLTGMTAQALPPPWSLTIDNVNGLARSTGSIVQRWRMAGQTAYALTLDFPTPVPADRLILVVEDVGFATGSLTFYNPTAVLSITGAGATPASPADFSVSDFSSGGVPRPLMQYNPATGGVRKTVTNISTEQLALVGNSSRLVSRIELTWVGLFANDVIGLYLLMDTACLTTQKNTLGAGGSFGFANSGLVAATSTLATGGSGASAQSTGYITRPGTALAVTETVPPGWQFTGASCVDANAPANGNPATPLGTLSGSRMDIAAVNNRPNTNLLCTFRNSWVLAQNDSAVTPAGTALAGASVLANDAGASLAITTLNGTACGGFPCVRALAQGNLSMNADGSYTFDPTPGFAGTVAVPYGVVDPENVTGAASLSIRFDPTATASPESGTATAGTTSTPIANIAANDRVNGVPATLGAGGNAVVSMVGTWPPGLTLDPNTGAVTATAGLPPSVAYVQDYQLCGRVAPAVCTSSQVTVLMLPLADMQATVQVPPSRLPDTPVQASFTCTNHGPTAAVGASCSLAPISGASVSCTPAAIPNPLPAGATVACSVVIPASAFASGTPLVLQATASSSTPDHVPANNTAQAQLPSTPTAIPVGGPMLPLMGIALAALAGRRLRRRR